jgi:hypothetical protein
MMPPPLPAVIKRVINRRKLPQVQVNHKPIFKLESIKKEVNRVQMDIISSANNTQREADIEKKVLRLTQLNPYQDIQEGIKGTQVQ